MSVVLWLIGLCVVTALLTTTRAQRDEAEARYIKPLETPALILALGNLGSPLGRADLAWGPRDSGKRLDLGPQTGSSR